VAAGAIVRCIPRGAAAVATLGSVIAQRDPLAGLMHSRMLP
jgi:hypothetical protein